MSIQKTKFRGFTIVKEVSESFSVEFENVSFSLYSPSGELEGHGIIDSISDGKNLINSLLK